MVPPTDCQSSAAQSEWPDVWLFGGTGPTPLGDFALSDRSERASAKASSLGSGASPE